MKTINKMMTNEEIYQCAIGLMNTFKENEISMPAAISFSITKNIKAMTAMAEEIEKYRIDILNKYGAKMADNNMISIHEDNVDAANKELRDLLTISQEVKVYVFTIEELSGINLTPTQMEAILFMIDEE